MLVAQIVGVIGLVLLIATFQVNTRKKMLRFQMASALAWTVHFLLLGAYTGAAMNLVTAVRNVVFIRYRRVQWVFWVMLVVAVAITALTFKNWTSLLPTVACIAGTIAAWQMNPMIIRAVALTGPPLWFVHNFFNGSYPGMIADSIAFGSVLVGMWRFDITPRLRRRQTALQELPIDNNSKDNH